VDIEIGEGGEENEVESGMEEMIAGVGDSGVGVVRLGVFAGVEEHLNLRSFRGPWKLQTRMRGIE
jgi:hypothetical protein